MVQLCISTRSLEIKITEVKDNENTEIIEQKEEIQKNNPYWDYIKMNLINVDFEE